MTKKKMNAHQPTSGALSLDAFIAGADPVSEAQNAPPRSDVVPDAPKVPSKAKKRSQGRPAAAQGAARNRVLQIRLTEAEYAVLNEKTGVASMAAVVRDLMQREGLLG